jgi:hypothetical protein
MAPRILKKKGQIDKPGSVSGHHLSVDRGFPLPFAAYPRLAVLDAPPDEQPAAAWLCSE